MVTRADLFADDEAAVRKAAEDKKRSDAWTKQYRAEKLVKDMERAKTVLDGELGELLKKMNAGTSCFKKEKNGRIISIAQHKVWYKSEHKPPYDGWKEEYERFTLGFMPDPTYKPTKILIKKLHGAGFGARTVAVEKENLHFVNDADGGGFEPSGGTHTIYCLEITW